MSAHLTDRDLLLHLDGELPPAHAASAGAHLQSCSSCRIRRLEIQQALANLEPAPDDEFPPAEAPRLRLVSQLARRRSRSSRRWLMAGAAAAVLVMLAAGVRGKPGSQRALLPDPHLTPGRTVAVMPAALCAAPESEPPAVDPATARAVFRSYGIANPPARSYELDYLITPALGGATDAANLWPQRYAEGEWNSRVKDALEDRLRSLVCSGNMDLVQAQKELAEDWIAAYRRHFRSHRPLVDHAAFVKDRPWE
jgi:hypothetical protein